MKVVGSEGSCGSLLTALFGGELAARFTQLGSKRPVPHRSSRSAVRRVGCGAARDERPSRSAAPEKVGGERGQ